MFHQNRNIVFECWVLGTFFRILLFILFLVFDILSQAKFDFFKAFCFEGVSWLAPQEASNHVTSNVPCGATCSCIVSLHCHTASSEDVPLVVLCVCKHDTHNRTEQEVLCVTLHDGDWNQREERTQRENCRSIGQEVDPQEGAGSGSHVL